MILSRPLLAGMATVFLVSISSASSQSLTVSSSSDGNGLYTYTFSRGIDPYVWGLSPTNGSGIYVQSYGVIETTQPPNWTASIDSGFIKWSVTNGLVFLEEPVSVSVRSIFRTQRNYNLDGPSPFNKGSIFGEVYSSPGHQPLEPGFGYFNLVGPDPTRLSIEQIKNNIVISYYAGLTNFQLEAVQDIKNSAGWSAVTNVPVIANDRIFVTNSPSLTSRFYRLSFR